jgi:hypothetical protein
VIVNVSQCCQAINLACRPEHIQPITQRPNPPYCAAASKPMTRSLKVFSGFPTTPDAAPHWEVSPDPNSEHTPATASTNLSQCSNSGSAAHGMTCHYRVMLSEGTPVFSVPQCSCARSLAAEESSVHMDASSVILACFAHGHCGNPPYVTD